MYAVRWIALFLLSVAIADLFGLALIVRRLGVGTGLLVFVVGLSTGLLVIRAPWQRWERSTRGGGRHGVPSRASTLSHLGAGALLAWPGVLTDILALCLLVPPLRRRLAAIVATGLSRSLSCSHRESCMHQAGAPSEGLPRDLTVRDAEFEMLREDRFPEERK